MHSTYVAGNLPNMEEGRFDKAVDRLNTAMDRLEAAVAARPVPSADTLPFAAASPNPNEASLIAENEAMRSEVRETLSALDALISGLER